MNICQAGHVAHLTTVVPSTLGDMVVYEWETYKDQAGLYCPGQDDISRTIINTQSWSPRETEFLTKILETGDRSNKVIDIGCHIGWFSKMAKSLGYEVEGFDGDAQHLLLYSLNVPDARSTLKWFDKDTRQLPSTEITKVELCKIDIEGNEQFAIVYLENYLKMQLIENIFIEISPVFNNSYPMVVSILEMYGYKAFELDGTPFDHDYHFDQKDLWFKKK